MDAVNKPCNISYKGVTDLVTEIDKMSEAVILEVVRKEFRDHLILGEEGGVIGDSLSDYLWCIDPLDGTTNFAHGYPSLAVSVGVIFQGKPTAAAVVEELIVMAKKIQVSQANQVEQSLLVTGFGYEHDDLWITNMNLFKEFTDVSMGVRRLGVAAVDMCHVALGIAEAYWEYCLKSWDMAVGVLIVEEAGGAVTCMNGGKFCVFYRSILVSNGVLHSKGPPKQPRGIECGYYVMRYIKEIVNDDALSFSTKWGGAKNRKSYTQEELDEVRIEVAHYIETLL